MNHSLRNIDERDTNAESYLEKIAKLFKESRDKNFPFKQVRRHEPKKSWIPNRIKRHIANTETDINTLSYGSKQKSNENYEKYKKKRNEVNVEITKAKRNEVQTKFD